MPSVMKVIQLPDVTEKMTVDPEIVSISPDSGGWLSLEQAQRTHRRNTFCYQEGI